MTKYMLIIETQTGDTAVIGNFPSVQAARSWEDEHEDKVTVIGCVPVIPKAEALRG